MCSIIGIDCPWNVVREITSKSQNFVEGFRTFTQNGATSRVDSIHLCCVSFVFGQLHYELLDYVLHVLVIIIAKILNIARKRKLRFHVLQDSIRTEHNTTIHVPGYLSSITCVLCLFVHIINIFCDDRMCTVRGKFHGRHEAVDRWTWSSGNHWRHGVCPAWFMQTSDWIALQNLWVKYLTRCVTRH